MEHCKDDVDFIFIVVKKNLFGSYPIYTSISESLAIQKAELEASRDAFCECWVYKCEPGVDIGENDIIFKTVD